MKDEERQLVPADDAELGEGLVPAFGTITPAMLEQLRRSVEAVKQAKLLALRVTNRRDWVDLGGNPYLQDSGAMKVGALFGITFRDLRVEQFHEEVDGKQVVRFAARVTAVFPTPSGARTMEMEGLASSDGDFYERGKDSAGNRYTRPLSEINLNNVRKHAVTNAQGRAIRKILGLSNLTWAEVNGAGIDADAVSKVDYGKSKQTREATAAESASQADRAWEMLLEVTGDEQNAAAYCEELTGFTAQDGKRVRGKRHPGELSAAWLKRAYPSIEKAYAAWKANLEPHDGE